MAPKAKKRTNGDASDVAGAPQAGPSNPMPALAAYQAALDRELQQLVQKIEQRRLVQRSTEALSDVELDSLVNGILERLPSCEGAAEVTKGLLEKALESTILHVVRIHAGIKRMRTSAESVLPVAEPHIGAMARQRGASSSLPRPARCSARL